MSGDRIVLPAEVREYFAAIGKRGGQSGRRELTREQAKLMVGIREAKREARKTATSPPKLTRKQQAILRRQKLQRRK
jgi:hypothetical protein